MKNYALYDVEHTEDFKSCLEGMCQRYADMRSVSFYDAAGELKTHTFSELREQTAELSEAICAEGLAGKRTAVLGGGYAYLLAIFAVTCAGGVAVLIDTEQSAEGIRKMAEFADAECALVTGDASELTGGLGLPVLTLDSGLFEKGRILRAEGNRFYESSEPNPDDTAVIIYTSGTGDRPKPVMLSHRAMITNACESIAYVFTYKKVFTSLPLFHAYGLTCAVLSNLMTGREVLLNSSIKRTFRDMKKFDPETVMAVPLIAEAIYKQIYSGAARGGKKPCTFKLIAAKREIFPGLKLIITGGAHLAETVRKGLSRCGVLVLEGYGITECSPLVSVNRNRRKRAGSAGIPLPSFEVRTEGGEIIVRGSCIMQGYYKQPELTAEALRGGWFRTGDLGYIDKAGFVHITGRSKSVIVLKNGQKISAEELESRLCALPLVSEAVAYGSAAGAGSDDVLPAVMVYPDPKETAGMSGYEVLGALQREVDKINETFPAYKQIRLVNIRETEFEKTALNKIKRDFLQDMREV